MSPKPLVMESVRTSWVGPRLAGISTLSLVFLCGAVVGGLAFNLGMHKPLHKAPFWTASGEAIYMEKVKKELDLTPTQVEQLETILDDFTKYYRSVVSDGKSRIMQILNEDQKRKFEQMLQERGGTREVRNP
jgi:hypothetical protein